MVQLEGIVEVSQGRPPGPALGGQLGGVGVRVGQPGEGQLGLRTGFVPEV